MSPFNSRRHGKPLSPVKRHKGFSPKQCRCEHCGAPEPYLYYNNGKKLSQLRCKVCSQLSQVKKRHRPAKKAKYFFSYCHCALYRWEQQLVTIYKCGNDQCPAYLRAKNKLNPSEKELQKKKDSQFKLRYQYREYHFEPSANTPAQINQRSIHRIHNSSDILGLVLAFHISCGITARKTAFILRNIFNDPKAH